MAIEDLSREQLINVIQHLNRLLSTAIGLADQSLMAQKEFIQKIEDSSHA